MKDVWKHIISWGKVIAVLAMVVKGALWVDARFDASAKTLDDIQQTVDYINIEQGFMADDISGIHDTLEKMEASGQAREQKIESIVWGMKHQDQFTPEDFEEIMDEMLKKNSYILEKIPWEWPEQLMVYPNTDLIGVK